MSYIFGALVMASLMAAIRLRPPANVERYLWAVLLEVPFLWAAHAQWPDESWQYASVYALFTAPILITVVSVTLDCLAARANRRRAMAVAIVLTSAFAHNAYLGMHGRYALISLTQGAILLWCGTLTAFASPHTRNVGVMFVLGFFWIFQAGWNLGWTLKDSAWAEWNWTVPPCIAIAAFLTLAWQLHGSAGTQRSLQRW